MESIDQYGERFDVKIQFAMAGLIVLSFVGVIWLNIAYSQTERGNCQPSDYTYCGPVEGYFGGVNGVSTISHGDSHGSDDGHANGHKDGHGKISL